MFDPVIFDATEFDEEASEGQAAQLGGTGGEYYRRNWPDTPKRRRVFDEVLKALEEIPDASEKEIARRVRRKLPGATIRQIRDALAAAGVAIEDDEAALMLLVA